MAIGIEDRLIMGLIYAGLTPEEMESGGADPGASVVMVGALRAYRSDRAISGENTALTVTSHAVTTGARSKIGGRKSLDALIADVFTIELCCNELGFYRNVRGRIINICKGWRIKNADTKLWDAAPLVTFRDLLSQPENQIRGMNDAGDKVIALISGVAKKYRHEFPKTG